MDIKVSKVGRPYKSIAMQAVVEREMSREAARIRSDLQDTVKTWDKKPTFKVDERKSPQTITIGTDSMIYKYVDEGTRPHPITAKRGKTLAFNTQGFKPKTTPNMIGSVKGARATAPKAFPVTVKHPGTAPRNFTKIIQRRSQRRFTKNLQRAITQVAKK